MDVNIFALKEVFNIKDFLGNETNIGDEVIITKQHYRNFQIGVVDTITDKMCFIKYGGCGCKQFHNQVINLKYFNRSD